MNISNLLNKWGSECPDKTAIVFNEERISFTQLKETSFKTANYLLSLGIKKTDKIGIFMPNTPEAIFTFLGVLSIGAIVVPLDFMLSQSEVINFLKHSQAKVFIIQPKNNIDLNIIRQECPDLKVITLPKDEDKELSPLIALLGSSLVDSPKVDIYPDDLSCIFYTSGSTGHPKGVMLNFSHLDNPVESINYFLKVNDKDIFLCGGVPFSHVGGFDYILLMIYFSTTLVLTERFHPLEFLKAIQTYKITIFCIVPAMYVAILSLKEYSKFNLSSLRYAVVFGAPSSPALLKRFNQIAPSAFLANGWGMTETAAPNSLSLPGVETIESIGKFTPGLDVKVVDNQGGIVEVDRCGELWVKGKAVMKGYYKEEDLTKEVLTEDNWLKTGDIVRCDQNGLFYIVGRKKDMIKVAGEIVFPPEVEEKIGSYPGIKEAAVIGVADDLRGEVPKVFIVVDQGEAFSERDLKEFLKNHLAHFKIPHHFEVVDYLPKNRTGKINKKVLQGNVNTKPI